jgi:uncharacterized Zn-binding protein involved in type VI secretion
MPAISRVGDIVGTAGRIVRGSTSVLVDGRPVGLHPSPVTPHPSSPVPVPIPGSPLKKIKLKGPGSIHPVSSTLMGSASMLVEGQPVLYVGGKTLCGHTIMTGSGSVIAGK